MCITKWNLIAVSIFLVFSTTLYAEIQNGQTYVYLNNNTKFNLDCSMKKGNPKNFYAPGPIAGKKNYKLIYDFSKKTLCPKTKGTFKCKICDKNNCSSGQVLAEFEAGYEYSYKNCNTSKPDYSCSLGTTMGPISVSKSGNFNDPVINVWTCTFSINRFSR